MMGGRHESSPRQVGEFLYARCPLRSALRVGTISASRPLSAPISHVAQSTDLLRRDVLLGSIARIPVGLLTDRFGGRIVFTGLFLLVAVPAWITPSASTYRELLVCAFFLGIAGSTFAAGVGFSARWFPPALQGTALGLYGLGNMGHSAAVFLGPVVATYYSPVTVFRPRRAVRGVGDRFYCSRATRRRKATATVAR